MTTNTAAWLHEAQARPFQIKAAPLGVPAEGQILIKNHAVAINPIDGKMQSRAIYKLDYPTVLGGDVAGEVVSVGPGVTQYEPGDRVIGVAAVFEVKDTAAAGFQAYTVLDIHLTSKIGNDISYERAVVLPLGFSTASAGLFNKDFLNLRLPTQPAQDPTGEALLVWGGASSVGCNAIQLAVASGYQVITTASPGNFSLVERLGASQAFDYNSPTVVSELAEAFRGKVMVGVYDAIGGPACAPILEFLEQVDGVKFVATTIPGFPEPPQGVHFGHVYSLSIRSNDIGKAVWNDFLPQALEAGSFIPAPEPLVAGKGLESIQNAVDLVIKGVSARKVVVVL